VAQWDSPGTAYESFMGRWSRRVAATFVADLSMPPGLGWLDVGCGTGALTGAILDLAEPASVDGVDASAAFVEKAMSTLGDRAAIRVGSGDALPFDDDSFDVVVSGLALNFMPDPQTALVEWRRVARPGALIAVYVWDYAGRMGFLRAFWDVVATLDPHGARQDQAERFAICRPDALEDAFETSGLHDVVTGAVEIVTRFRDFDDYWLPFLDGVGPAGAYLASIDAPSRERLSARLRETLAGESQAGFELPARAWTATGLA
jgi:SAM-dependent methyltransferase